MIKSITFYFLLYVWTIFLGLICIPYLLLPKEKLYKPAYLWIKGIFFLLDKICNLTHTIEGIENVSNINSKIVASKHQSTFETLLLFTIFPKAIFIHKRELFFIPIFGFYLKKISMISIDRSGKFKTLKKMIDESKFKVSKGYTLIIFPEGTRKKPGSVPDYKSGVAGIYKELNSDVIPVALNSGLFWPKNSFVIKPGKIIIEFLPIIEKGLDKKIFIKKLEETIENKTKSLIS